MDIIRTEEGVIVLTDQQVTHEIMTFEDIDREISDTKLAIDDIENFKERRLQNLIERLSVLNSYKQVGENNG